MEKEKLNKKQITALVIGVLTMIILVSSATYAYFRVSIGNTATITTITGDIGGGTLGTITLDGGGTELYLGISAYDMSETEIGTTYYSSTTEGSRETNLANAGKTTYTATLTGEESDSMMYACDYEFTVTASGSMLGYNGVELVFEGDINKTLKFNSTAKTTQIVSGIFRKISSSNPIKEFNAYLQLTNTSSNQNSLAGTNLSVEIENTKWKCYLLDDSDLVGDAYALLTETALTFVRSETPIVVGDTHNNEEIIEVYTNFEDSTYDPSWNLTDWYDDSEKTIIFEDVIRPISTAGWFYIESWSPHTIDLTKLDTSLVTDMSNMFYIFGATELNLIGLENLDVSKVTNMSRMFVFEDPQFGEFSLDLSGWDVSNVTDMSSMFYFWEVYEEVSWSLDLTGWDVSNVTDMSKMFFLDYEEDMVSMNLVGLENFDVSSVTNMSGMFKSVILENDLDLSGWDVSNVDVYTNFGNISAESTGILTPPIWILGYFSVYSETDHSLRIYDLETSTMPKTGDTYNTNIVTAVNNINLEGTPIKCDGVSVVPTQIIVEDDIYPTSLASWFSGCTKVNTIDVSKLDTSNVTNMRYMFRNVGSDSTVTSMTIIGIDSFDTSKVTSMSSMFYNFGLNATYTLDLSGWDVSNVSKYSYLEFNYGVESKIIEPTWPTTN